MQLANTPEHKETTIVVGTSARKPEKVLQAYLNSLAAQVLPPRVRLLPFFISDYDRSDPAEKLLKEWAAERQGTVMRGGPKPAQPDFSDGPEHDSHQWGLSAMHRVGANKNSIIRYAIQQKADYVFFADTDLILDNYTINSLLAVDKPISTAVYWTHWSKHGFETRRIHAAPQVWLNHPYELSGRGLDEAEFRERLINRQLQRVWGFGACTLIHAKVLEAGINFEPLADVPQQGLMAGEDRQFCIRAERGHIEAFADGWPDIFHIYHAEQHANIQKMATRLSVAHNDRAQLGDLVSVKLEALEPLPHANGSLFSVPRQHVRGRLGALALMPEVEESIYAISRGQSVIIPVHFPIHHQVGFLRNRRRLIRVTLVDCKPYGFAPIVEQELFVGSRSGKWADTTTLTTEQLNAMANPNA
jgi:hypothetical protein